MDTPKWITDSTYPSIQTPDELKYNLIYINPSTRRNVSSAKTTVEYDPIKKRVHFHLDGIRDLFPQIAPPSLEKVVVSDAEIQEHGLFGALQRAIDIQVKHMLDPPKDEWE